MYIIKIDVPYENQTMLTSPDVVPMFDVLVDLHGSSCRLDVRSESLEIIAQILQQVIWMGAALRLSDNERVQYSSFELNSQIEWKDLQIAQFAVIFGTSDLSEAEEHSCWVSLFANAVIAQGFLVPKRQNDEHGLEVSLEMMAALGGARQMTNFDGGLVMKGHSTLFVPVERHPGSVQWHCLYASDETRLTYRELRNQFPNRALLDVVNYETIKGTRAFLGWWGSGETHLGTADTDYGNIDWSPAAEARRSTRFSGTEIGFQTMVTGKLSFCMGPKDGRLHFSRGGPFLKVIKCAENTPVVLYDLEDRRAWFVSALDVMLHVCLTRHRLSPYHADGESVEFVFADPRRHEGYTTKDAILHNQSRKIYEGDISEQDYHFKDAILDIWSQMERLLEKENAIEANPGVPLHGTMRSKLKGWEYMSLVHEKNYRQKEVHIEKSSGGWVDLVDSIDCLVLFATGFKEIIKPAINDSHLCRKWRSLPKGKDYLATNVPMLEMLYSEAGSRISREFLSTNRLQWHRGSLLFEPCKAKSPYHCQCDRTQQIYHDSWFETFGRIRRPGKLEPKGCVVFGQAHHAFKPARNSDIRENSVHRLPNIPLQISQALSPTSPPMEEFTETVSPTANAKTDFRSAPVCGTISPMRYTSPSLTSDDTFPEDTRMPKRRRKSSIRGHCRDAGSRQLSADRSTTHPIRLHEDAAEERQDYYPTPGRRQQKV